MTNIRKRERSSTDSTDAWFNVRKINITHHIKKLNKNCMIISINSEKHFCKPNIHSLFKRKKTQQTRIKRDLPQSDKEDAEKNLQLTSYSIVKTECISRKINKARMSTSITSIQHCTGDPSYNNKTRRRNRGIQIGKEKV